MGANSSPINDEPVQYLNPGRQIPSQMRYRWSHGYSHEILRTGCTCRKFPVLISPDSWLLPPSSIERPKQNCLPSPQYKNKFDLPSTSYRTCIVPFCSFSVHKLYLPRTAKNYQLYENQTKLWSRVF